MPAIVLVGAQWGDEGKGKATDLLGNTGEVIDYVVKFNGGNNAGHTVVIGTEKYALHLLPSGILTPGVIPVIGNGVVVDLSVLFEELDALEARGVDTSRLVVSASAHLIPPYNRTLDKVAERFLGTRVPTIARWHGGGILRNSTPGLGETRIGCRFDSPGLRNWNILASKLRTKYRHRFSTEHFIDG